MARVAPVAVKACASGLPLTFVLRKATVAPSLASPNQAKKNAGRFSTHSATTSPHRTPRPCSACAVWLMRELASA
jgi:hypothetical protein